MKVDDGSLSGSLSSILLDWYISSFFQVSVTLICLTAGLVEG